VLDVGDQDVATYDNLSVATGPAGRVILRCPTCGVLPVPHRETTLSDLTNVALEHLSDVHADSLALAVGLPVADRATASAQSPTDQAVDLLPDDMFWSLIALLGPQGAAGDAEALTRGLAALPMESIHAFDHHLVKAVEALDTPEHACQTVFDLHDLTPVASPVPALMFLYARVAAVAAGPEVYSSVLADPHQLGGGWPLRAAQLVLGAAPAAARRVTGRSWDPGPGGAPPAASRRLPPTG
jgi:hypothetical protein